LRKNRKEGVAELYQLCTNLCLRRWNQLENTFPQVTMKTNASSNSSYKTNCNMNSPKPAQAVLIKDRFILKNGKPQPLQLPCTCSSTEFLAAAPRGSYTSARTVGRNAVLEFDFHVKRLVDSAVEIFSMGDALSVNNFRPIFLQSVRSALQTFASTYSTGRSSELKISSLLTNVDYDQFPPPAESTPTVVTLTELVLFTHVCQLPSISANVIVQVRTAHRNNPNVKDTEWVQIRKALENQLAMDENEILLQTDDEKITEGTQSNLFVVDAEGTVVTAPSEAVLEGTIRKIVVELCALHNIPLKFELPDLKQVSTWQGAFLTSTSRIVLPISCLRFPENSGKVGKIAQFALPSSPVVDKIRELTFKELVNRSTVVIESL